MSNEFIKLLNNEKLRGEIINAVKTVCSEAGVCFEEPKNIYFRENYESDEEYQKMINNPDWEDAWYAGLTGADIEGLFRNYIFDKIEQPWPITPEELTETLYDMVRSKEFADSITDEAVENLYDIFLSYVENHFLSYRRSLPFTICKIRSKDTSFIKWFLIGRLEDENERIKLANQEFNKEYDKSKILWTKNDISVIIEPRLDKRSNYQADEKGNIFREDEYSINAIVIGRISPASLKKMYGQISRCLPSIIRSFALLYPLEGRSFINFNDLPQVDEHFFEKNGALIKNCLDLFFTEPTKKDTIDRRVRNAVHLLVESDNQTVDTIGLALSITAMEALLSQGSNGISEKLGTIAAALLEPDSSERAKAKKFVKDLYDQRSRALHGEKIEMEPQARKNARHLAAAVLIAVLNIRYLSKHGSEAEALVELKKLYDDPYQSGLPAGVLELNIRSLWTNKKD